MDLSSPGHHLRSNVLRGPTEGLQYCLEIHQFAQAHVRDLHNGRTIVGRTEEYVFCFEVSVADFHGVQVLDSRGNLIEMQLRFGFVQFGFLDNFVEQFSSLRQLEDNEEIIRGLNDYPPD